MQRALVQSSSELQGYSLGEILGIITFKYHFLFWKAIAIMPLGQLGFTQHIFLPFPLFYKQEP